MSRMKSGAILLLLLIPFGLYCAWQVQSVTSADLSAAEPPSEKGLPGKDQLAAGKAKAEKWAGDVKRASAVTMQYRAPTAEDAIEDAGSKSLATAVASRAADLTDLEKFLSDAENPNFTGTAKLQAKYKEWQESKKRSAKAEQAVTTWLGNPLPSAVESSAVANTTMKGFEELVTEYRNASVFADLGKAELWRIEARLKVIQSLDGEARAPYAEAMKLTLPFPKNHPTVAKAVGAPAAIREQVQLLKDDLERADDAKRTVPGRLTKAAAEAVAKDGEWAAKAELLALFADPALFTDPKKAGEWIPRIQTQFNKAQSERDEIKRKVKQFCDAYIPKSVRLDASVIIEKAGVAGKPEPRSGVSVTYDSDAKTQKLTDSLERDQLNEFNYLELYKDPDTIWSAGGSSSGSPKSTKIKPTTKSHVARDFTAARKDVTTWSIDTVNRLKTACEGEVEALKKEFKLDDAKSEALQKERRDLADALLGAEPGGDKKDAPKLWTRLSELASVMEKHKGLFEGP